MIYITPHIKPKIEQQEPHKKKQRLTQVLQKGKQFLLH